MVVTPKKLTRNEKRNEARKAEKEARKEAVVKSNTRKVDRNISNCKSEFKTAEEELEDREKIAADVLKVYKKYLPGILENLSEIKDPRNPESLKHKLAMLMLYGIFSFVLHMKSRRDADKKLSPIFMENMRVIFPELSELPHSCALARLLEDIDVMKIEETTVKFIKKLIMDKKFVNYLVSNQYVIAVDGVHKFTREEEWCENSLKKHKKGQPEDVNQYYANALEASLVLPEGVTIPLMSEFMDRKEHSDVSTNTEKLKQDCELKAFKRLAERLKKYFPRLSIVLTLDGLYANGPLMDLCQSHGWDYMIVLKDGSLKTVWQDIEELKRCGLSEKHSAQTQNGVNQRFWWVNGIDYQYGEGKDKSSVLVNVVVCEETYTRIDSQTGEEVETKSKFAWISCKKITGKNVEKRCNRMGRPRWNIETQNLIEKYHGYAYSHCFSENWEVMKGYHYLMHLGHIINILTLYSTDIIKRVTKLGARRTIEKFWLIFEGNLLNRQKIEAVLDCKYQIRLVI
jgi:hypothetical protein